MTGPESRILDIPDFLAITIGFVVFFLGAFLTRHVAFLRNYNIPEPVSGGIAVALATWVVYSWFGIETVFDLSTRDELLVFFFTTIGLNARLSDLIAGGRMLALLLVMTLAFIVLQNVIGLLGATLFGFPAPVGTLIGSASLIGGHGTAIAWGPTIQAQTGFPAASEIGIAAATLGLIVGALMGGPIAKTLIDRNNLQSIATDGEIVGVGYESDGAEKKTIDHVMLMRVLLAVNVAVIIGYFAHQAITEWGLKLPLFVPCLLAGMLLSNTVPHLFPRLPWPARTPALAVVSDYCLSLFLAMSLMSMQLWTLAGLGGPLIAVLALQAIATAAIILFVFFQVLGSDYTAAVLSAGFAGFTLGATPTAIANMSSVTKRYGPAPLAFIVLPLVSAFFVDLANAFVIGWFVTF
ncbi:sodium/glutamate symporter [Microbaculum marinisediminis]|uniref:Sodium/glutamate symporter n=1 Tax=Microbaculum marinisediminis TaxID=2931392 RepID=A0AAW5R3U7_9HYPH|nr:sodium/glutamate symporter [Microbaculum sp. A6E488]MCT8974065.1 sodium/glutamate symporter [Microbaculum sp. A6E488]